MGETLPLDEEMVRYAGVNPRVLFIPTASGDDPLYIQAFHQIFHDRLGCRTDELCLHSAPTEAGHKIELADLIYVGGGNTRMMVRLWRELGVDHLLATAAKRGAVLGGLSAGMICWIACGCSDSARIEGIPDASLERVEGLGYIAAMGCPHLSREPDRWPGFIRLMGLEPVGRVGLGLDDLAALKIENGIAEVLTADDRCKAYRLVRTPQGVEKAEFAGGPVPVRMFDEP